MLRLIIHQLGVLPENVVTLRTCCVLQLEHRLRVEHMMLAFTTPLVFTAEFKFAVSATLGVLRVGNGMTRCNFRSKFIKSDTTKATHCASEVLINQFVSKTNCFKNLRSGIRSDSAHAHLRHDLQDALARSLDVLLQCIFGIDTTKTMNIFTNHVFD